MPSRSPRLGARLGVEHQAVVAGDHRPPGVALHGPPALVDLLQPQLPLVLRAGLRIEDERLGRDHRSLRLGLERAPALLDLLDLDVAPVLGGRQDLAALGRVLRDQCAELRIPAPPASAPPLARGAPPDGHPLRPRRVIGTGRWRSTPPRRRPCRRPRRAERTARAAGRASRQHGSRPGAGATETRAHAPAAERAARVPARDRPPASWSRQSCRSRPVPGPSASLPT